MITDLRALLPCDILRLFKSRVINDRQGVFIVTFKQFPNDPEYTVGGEVDLINNTTYHVHASIFRAGDKDALGSAEADGLGCQVGGNYAPGLDAAFETRSFR